VHERDPGINPASIDGRVQMAVGENPLSFGMIHSALLKIPVGGTFLNVSPLDDGFREVDVQQAGMVCEAATHLLTVSRESNSSKHLLTIDAQNGVEDPAVVTFLFPGTIKHIHKETVSARFCHLPKKLSNYFLYFTHKI